MWTEKKWSARVECDPIKTVTAAEGLKKTKKNKKHSLLRVGQGTQWHDQWGTQRAHVASNTIHVTLSLFIYSFINLFVEKICGQ
jgi:hypothetical protein